jgi:hypothetical protein
MKKTSIYAVLTRFGIIAAVLATLVLSAPAASAAVLEFDHPEKSTETIATFSATDAEDDDIEWSTGGDDGGKFKAAGGVLTWKSAPDFESPGDKDKNNVYKVTVIATSGLQSSSQAVEVTVTNEEEPGTVEFDEIQPQVGNVITAKLTDDDIVKLGKKWQWSRSADKETWTDIEKAAASAYTPAAADVGSYLRATVTYKDGKGSEEDMAMEVTDSAVVEKPTANAAPSFPDQNPSTTAKEKVAYRLVNENSGKGTAVGEPVVASDPNNDAVLYSLDAVTGIKLTDTSSSGFGLKDEEENTDGVQVTLPGDTVVTTVTLAGAAHFKVKPKTGQIVVEKKDVLDFEDNAKKAYAVELTARDPSGAKSSVAVIVKVEAVNEKPAIDDLDTTSGANGTALSIDENGKMSFSVTTDATADPVPTVVAANTGVSYTAKDPDTLDEEGTDDDDTQSLTWTVAGDDGGKFTITSTGESGRGGLTWKSEPNFESPGDKDKNNVYKVTVIATSGLQSSSQAVEVTVTNEEEPGTVEFDEIQPQVGNVITATLTDGDIVKLGKKWQWSRSADKETWTDIEKAAASTYTPAVADVGSYLRRTVRILLRSSARRTWTRMLATLTGALEETTVSCSRPTAVP